LGAKLDGASVDGADLADVDLGKFGGRQVRAALVLRGLEVSGLSSSRPRISCGYGFWAAIEKASGDFLGWFHFRSAPGSAPDEPELGYRLRKAAWGKGY
jgi:hypothetical protein